MRAKIALILSFMITVSAISYFSVINAATLSSVPDTASSYTTDICEPTIVAQETVLFILSNANTEKSTQDDLSVTDGNIHYIGPDETPPAGHGWSNQWSIKTEPTCTQQGEEIMLCNGCNDVCIRTLPALEHNLNTVTTPSTCTENGSQVTTCSRCDYFDTKVIPALGHDLSTTVTEPNCITEGSEVTTCSRCDYSETKAIPALGHNLSTTVIEPTCTENGLTIDTCSLCGFTSSESLPALGHEWTYAVTEPTCTQEGNNTMVCSVCHEQHTESIPAAGHHLSTVTIEPTDTQDGSVTTTCAFGDYQTTEILPKSETPVNLAASNQVSALSESLVTQLQLLRNYMSSSLSAPSASHGPKAVDAVFGTLSIGVIIAGGIILYPYFTLFQWVNKKKKAAIKNIFGGKTK